MNRPSYIALVDAEGYEMRSFPVMATNRTATIIGGPFEGKYISGRSDRQELKPISNPNTWRSLLELEGPESLVQFQTKYGPLIRIGPGERFFEPWDLLKPRVEHLSKLAKCADSYDAEEFLKLVAGRSVLVQCLASLPSRKGGRTHWGLAIEFRSLTEFLIWQMWNACGEQDHPARERAKTCKHCGKMFGTGRARAAGGRRADAQYCERTCTNAASKRRRRAARALNKFECTE